MRVFLLGALCGVGAMAVAAAGLAELWYRQSEFVRRWD